MKIAVTGASGYVGKKITESFRVRGHDVQAWSRRKVPGEWVNFDLKTNPNTLPWHGIDVLVHTAYDFQARGWDDIAVRNIDPSIALLKAAKHHGVAKLVFISSISSFPDAISDYGRAKLKIEKTALELGALIIRPGLIWGESSGGVMGALEQLVEKSPVIPYLCGRGGLSQFLVHEEDLAQTLIYLTENFPENTPSIHEVAHSTPVSLRNIVHILAQRRMRFRLYLPIPWQLALGSLRFLEAIGVHPLFRSDSLTGLVYRNPAVNHTPPPPSIQYRPFA
jgi:nucleoside-diphosphate-sugar epimerase